MEGCLTIVGEGDYYENTKNADNIFFMMDKLFLLKVFNQMKLHFYDHP